MSALEIAAPFLLLALAGLAFVWTVSRPGSRDVTGPSEYAEQLARLAEAMRVLNAAITDALKPALGRLVEGVVRFNEALRALEDSAGEPRDPKPIPPSTSPAEHHP